MVQSTRTIYEARPAQAPPPTRRPRDARLNPDRWLLVKGAAYLALDVGLAWFAFWLAYVLRYELEVPRPLLPQDQEPFATFQGNAALFAGLTAAVFMIRGLYRLPRRTGLLDEASMVTGGLTTAMAGVTLWAFLLRFAPSRLVFVYAGVIAVILLLGRRVVTRVVRRRLWLRGIGVDRVLVVGAGETGRRVMQALMGQPALGYRVVGFVDDGLTGDAVAVATEHRVVRAERLGTTADVGEIVTGRRVDEVIIALPAAAHERVLAIVDQCRARAVTFKVVPDLFQLALDRVDIGEVSGVPLIGVRDASIRGANYWLKRSMDIAVAATVLVVMAIPMGLIALLVRRDSAGPVLWRQRRIGRNGVPFTISKFRTMVDNADEQRPMLIATSNGADPLLFKLPADPRVTPVGRVLRRWSLDELPQFWHVLRGEMSLVGPRPPLPEEVSGYEEWHRQRLLVTPGLTGLWQVNGRSTLSFDEMVRLDLYYAEHWSPWLDIKIVLRTVPAVLSGEGAY